MPRKRGGKTSPEAIKRAMLHKEIIDLRLQGFTESKIAERLGISTSSVHRIVVDEIEKIRPKETAVQFLSMQHARYEEDAKVNRAGMHAGDPVQSANYWKAMDRLDRLWGVRGGTEHGGTQINLNIGSDNNDKPEHPGFTINFKPGLGPEDMAPHQWLREPPPDGNPRYSAQIKQFPRLEYASPIPPAEPPHAPRPEPPGPQGHAQQPLNQHQIYEQSFQAQQIGPHRTEATIPVNQRFGFSTGEMMMDPPRRKKGGPQSWME
jgi:hypothetical protein